MRWGRKDIEETIGAIQMKNDEGRNYSRALLKRMALIPDILRAEIDGSWGQKRGQGTRERDRSLE